MSLVNEMRSLELPREQHTTPVHPPITHSHKSSMQTIGSERRVCHRSSRVHTDSHHHWELHEERRENRLNALFNRRKTLLQTISRKNKDIYARILQQESHYGEAQPAQPRLPPETLTQASKMLLTLSKQAMLLDSKSTAHQQECGLLGDIKDRVFNLPPPGPRYRQLPQAKPGVRSASTGSKPRQPRAPLRRKMADIFTNFE